MLAVGSVSGVGLIGHHGYTDSAQRAQLRRQERWEAGVTRRCHVGNLGQRSAPAAGGGT